MKHSLLVLFVLCEAGRAFAQTTRPFDGSRWNISTGNQSVAYIQASPIGAHPRPLDFEPPPAQEVLKQWKDMGLVAFEDYIAWGAVEREPGKWDWSQHDKTCDAFKAAGLKYVAYTWVHFPPLWLRNSPDQRTLMQCLEHHRETNYLSIFDPRTLEYYDHFYKALHEHFGDRIDSVYACILGPYGEGNYPLEVQAWINMGHCHEGYWCGDEYALKAFRTAARKKYPSLEALNDAWGTSFKSFDEVTFPEQIKEGYKATPAAFPTPALRRWWIDFVEWYHQAIIDFAEGSIKVVLKYYPKEKVRLKPGGNAGGVNPIAWGTYCPGYAKMAGPYGIVLQPADCQGAVFGDKWVGTAYAFYGVKLSTEPAGGLNRNDFVRRIFSDASAGAAQFFTYEFPAHVADMQTYIGLYTGRMSETSVAVYCPTTLYRLGGDLRPTISRARELRDVADFDVLDELLIRDGALTTKYKVLVVFQSNLVDRPVLDKIDAWLKSGGQLAFIGRQNPRDLENRDWKPPAVVLDKDWLGEFASRFASIPGVDGAADGVWTARRAGEVFRLNTTDKPVTIDGVTIAPHEIAIPARN